MRKERQLQFTGRAMQAAGLGLGLISIGICAVRRRVSPLARAGLGLAALSGSLGTILRSNATDVDDASRPLDDPIDRLVPPSDESQYSIIIPVYNRPKDLIALLMRIDALMPGWSDLGSGEVLIVDDGSTDETVAAARAFTPINFERPRIVTQPNRGVSAARNAGFANARSRIAVSIDSDCLPNESWLRAMLSGVRGSTQSLIFGNVVSDRKPIFPIEQSPAGFQFVSATFACHVDEYLRLGGNSELYTGHLLEDRDFMLKAEIARMVIEHTPEPVIWHPIRSLKLFDSWDVGAKNQYDNLLASRHGLRALPFLRNRFFGGQWFGSFPSGALGTAGCVNVLLIAWLFLTGDEECVPDAKAFAGLSLFSLGMYWICASAMAIRFRVAPARIPSYAASLTLFMFSAFLARMKGTMRFGLPLL